MNKNLSKLLFIFSAVIVFGFMFNMFGDGDVVPMPMNERVQVLDGNYTVVGDVNGQLLIGYKEPYQGDTDDAAAYNTYINTSSFADVSILDVQGSSDVREPKSISFEGRLRAVNGQPSNETAKLTNFFQPCYSKQDQKIYQIAHKYKQDGYRNSGERVLLSFNSDGEYEMYTADILGTGYIENNTPFYVSEFRDCKIEIAVAYGDEIGKPCEELNLPFTCLDISRERQPFEVIEVQAFDFTKQEVQFLVASAQDRETWPVEVEITKPDGSQQSLALPAGDFVQDSGFWKKMRCFSCGCGCYQKLALGYLNNDLYLIASGWAIDDAYRGVYRLTADQTWERVLALTENAGYMKQVGQCVLAWDELGGDDLAFMNRGIRWVNFCDATAAATP